MNIVIILKIVKKILKFLSKKYVYLCIKYRCTMDVSRIEAFNPNNIRWQSLTAKEILKLEDQGIDVPSLYLNWAQNFINYVEAYRNDDVTYERAEFLSDNNFANKQSADSEDINDAKISNNIINSENGKSVEKEDSISLTPAQLKRKNLTDNGVDLRVQAETFINDSNKSTTEANLSSTFTSSKEQESMSEIQSLEAEIQSLLSEASVMQNDLRNRINNINNGQKITSDDIAKINELSKSLENYGNNGLSRVDSSEMILGNIDTEINSISPSFDNALDFGSETMNIGNELILQAMLEDFLSRMFDLTVGHGAVSSGQTSVNSANKGLEIQNIALNTNSSNMSSVMGYRREVSDKTGVVQTNNTPKNKGDDVQEKNSNNIPDTLNQNNNEGKVKPADEKDQITGKVKEENKDIKTAQNDGTDETDKINIDINEILKRKVRLGLFNKDS